jgi:hypothetical protein
MPGSQRASSSLHPSYLALDRAAWGAASSDVTAHVAGCDECQRYLAALARAPLSSAMAPIRAGLARAHRGRQRARRFRAIAGASAILAAAGVLLLVGRVKPPIEDQPAPYVGAKGFSSVWIYVKRGSATKLWDGKQTIAQGDRLRIKVDPAGYRRVEVYSVKNVDAPELLYSGGGASTRSMTLPDAWEIDGEPGAERLMVVFSNAPVKPNWSAWLRGQVEPGVVVLPFVLPKAGVASPDASGGP